MSNTDQFLAKLTTLAATPGKKDKLAIVQTFNEFERDLAKRALDPTVSYYIAKIDTPPTGDAAEEWASDEIELLDKLSSRQITGKEATDALGFHLADLTPSASEVLRRVVLKDLKCGVGVSIVNAAFPGLVPDFAYMRCSLPKASNIEKWDWSWGVFCQLKADGMFARVGVTDDGQVLITSRQGNTFPANAMAKLSEQAGWAFKRGTETHGELTVWIDGELQPRTTGNGMLNSLQQGGELPADAVIKFDCWDQIPLVNAVPKGSYSTPYRERYGTLLEQVLATGCNLIEMIEGRVVYSRAEAMTAYKAVLARGLEGVILKHPQTTWRDGDSKDQVKFKLEVDVDLKIVGFREGEVGKRTEHTFGSVLCQTIDGQLEVAVSGFKRDMGQYLHENRDSVLGRIMCVRANDVSVPSPTNELHSLFHPRFIELRDDKYEADTLQGVIDQFEAAVA